MHNWHRNGFPELGDTGGLTPEGVVARAAAAPGFMRDPEAASRVVSAARPENGALIRIVACAATIAPADWAALYCRATHHDPRCAASAVALAEMCAALVRLPPGAAVDPGTATEPVRAGRGRLADEAHREDYSRRLIATKALAEMALGEREGRSFTLKTLACAMWALRRLIKTTDYTAGFFRETLRELASEGGDASANCAVAGAVLGAALGAGALPEDWLAALPHLAWLEKEIKDFIDEVSKTWDE